MDVSLRLKSLRLGERFGFICSPGQLEKLNRVILHNGGETAIAKRDTDAVFVNVRRVDEETMMPRTEGTKR